MAAKCHRQYMLARTLTLPGVMTDSWLCDIVFTLLHDCCIKMRSVMRHLNDQSDDEQSLHSKHAWTFLVLFDCIKR